MSIAVWRACNGGAITLDMTSTRPHEHNGTDGSARLCSVCFIDQRHARTSTLDKTRGRPSAAIETKANENATGLWWPASPFFPNATLCGQSNSRRDVESSVVRRSVFLSFARFPEQLFVALGSKYISRLATAYMRTCVSRQMYIAASTGRHAKRRLKQTRENNAE